MKTKSPFQKFIDSIHGSMIYKTEIYYKEGWNEFANVLSEWIEKEGMPAEINPVGILQKIREMKEP